MRLATDAAAKGFRRLWEDDEKGWKVAWARTPDHLKIGVRDATFLKWGGYLYVTMIQEVCPLSSLVIKLREVTAIPDSALLVSTRNTFALLLPDGV